MGSITAAAVVVDRLHQLSRNTMTLLWTGLYGILCAEVALISVLLLTCIPPRTWAKLLSYLSWLYAAADRLLGITWYFWAFIVVLAVIFINCLTELWKWEEVKSLHKGEMSEGGLLGRVSASTNMFLVDGLARQQDSTNLFRAQRNVYISGLTLFLALVVRRIMGLILELGKCDGSK